MMLSTILLWVGLQAAPEKETVQVAGTKLSFEMVRIPGTPELRPFSIGIREVTWGEFNHYFHARKDVDAVTRPTNGTPFFGSLEIPNDFLEPGRPVVIPRWHTALAYCEWLSRKTGRTFRLPTEKEWEYAARAGETAAAPAAPDDVAGHIGNSDRRTHEAGGRKPNAFGLYDMLGNVWEYCLEFDQPPA